MKEDTAQLTKFFEEKRPEILARFNEILKEYKLPVPLTVLEVKISYSGNPPVAQPSKEWQVIYEDDKYIVLQNV